MKNFSKELPVLRRIPPLSQHYPPTLINCQITFSKIVFEMSQTNHEKKKFDTKQLLMRKNWP